MHRPLLILMAEDDADDRLLAREALFECPRTAELRFVEDGEELLDYLGHSGKYSFPEDAPRPDLILLDLNMPRLDGREALRRIKSTEEFRRIPIVVMTTSNSPEDINLSYDAGANSFITKPLSFSELVELMKLVGNYWLESVALPV